MTIKKIIIPTGLLTFMFVAGSIGLLNTDFYTYTLLFVLLLAFGLEGLKGKSIKISLGGALLLTFLFVSLPSLYFSVDIERSIDYFLLYFLCFGYYLYFLNFSKEFKSRIGLFLISSGVVLCSISLVTLAIPSLGYEYLDGYQLIFSRFGSHNHLGDFLVLPIMYCLYKYIKTANKKVILPLVLFMPFFIFSYSRSAYLSFFFSMFIMLVYLRRSIPLVPRVLFAGLLLVCLVLLAATVSEARSVTLLKPVNQFLDQSFGLKYKTLLGERDNFYSTAMMAAQRSLWVGVGPGNYTYAYEDFSQARKHNTESSHNFVLDILVENGILALLFVMLFLIVMFRNLDSIYGILSIALLVNFMTDYTHRIGVMIILFFVLLGLKGSSKELE